MIRKMPPEEALKALNEIEKIYASGGTRWSDIDPSLAKWDLEDQQQELEDAKERIERLERLERALSD